MPLRFLHFAGKYYFLQHLFQNRQTAKNEHVRVLKFFVTILLLKGVFGNIISVYQLVTKIFNVPLLKIQKNEKDREQFRSNRFRR